MGNSFLIQKTEKYVTKARFACQRKQGQCNIDYVKYDGNFGGCRHIRKTHNARACGFWHINQDD